LTVNHHDSPPGEPRQARICRCGEPADLRRGGIPHCQACLELALRDAREDEERDVRVLWLETHAMIGTANRASALAMQANSHLLYGAGAPVNPALEVTVEHILRANRPRARLGADLGRVVEAARTNDTDAIHLALLALRGIIRRERGETDAR